MSIKRFKPADVQGLLNRGFDVAPDQQSAKMVHGGVSIEIRPHDRIGGADRLQIAIKLPTGARLRGELFALADDNV